MNLVYQSAFLKALGWSLLDSLWQMGALWIIYVLFTANGKRFHARQRHMLGLLSLAGGSLWFLVSLVVNFYKAAAAPLIHTILVEPGELVNNSPSWFSLVSAWVEPLLPLLSSAYLLVAFFLVIRFYRQYRITKVLAATGLKKINPELRVYLQQATLHLSIHKKVNIWLSSLVDTPLTIGFWKPIILLPIAAVNNLTIEQTEAIILHELYHIKRNDYLVNLLVACTDILFFFNPFARLLSGIIRREREHSCDDIVLQFRYDAAQYAAALLMLEKTRTAQGPLLAVAATGRNQTLLLNRVKRMLTKEPVTHAVSHKLAAWLLTTLLIGFIGWYNPGRAIITTIREVAANTPENGFNEVPVSFATSTSGSSDNDATENNTDQDSGNNPAQIATKVGLSITPARDVETEEPDIDEEEMERALASQALQNSIDIATAQRNINMNSNLVQMANLVSSPEMREFSLRVTKDALAAIGSIKTHPFVPGNSFAYQILEDTLLPKNMVTKAEKEAAEALEKALKALKEINWDKLEKEINANQNGTQLNINQLQAQINKAIKEVDWKKINEEAENGVKEAQQQIAAEQEAVRLELEKYKQTHRLQEEKTKVLQQRILLERLGENNKIIVEGSSARPDTSGIKVRVMNGKKIVVI